VAGKRHRRVRDAVHARELAERLFATAAADGQPAALVVVATTGRRVEILTADWARSRLPDAACEEAIELMRPALLAGSYDDALVIALGHLASVAGVGDARPGATDLPDLFDEG
jgi:uncharacterized membrane protein YgcG